MVCLASRERKRSGKLLLLHRKIPEMAQDFLLQEAVCRRKSTISERTGSGKSVLKKLEDGFWLAKWCVGTVSMRRGCIIDMVRVLLDKKAAR